MQWLFDSGHAADVILAVLAAEAAFLKIRGWTVRDIALALGPAVLLVLGLRAALVDAAWPWIALPLALAFPVHIADLLRRRQSQR